MDLYHIWFNLRPGVRDTELCEALAAYLGALQVRGAIAGYRLTRRKLGLGPADLGEFHVVIEVDGLAQLDRAFTTVAERSNPIEGLHAAVNRQIGDFRAALYRDFPDPQRKRGEEDF
jgi:hypothetical protein